MIEAKHINKTFGALHVLKDVSLSIAKGEIVAIIGPSGAGKTTLLQILGTLSQPDAGGSLAIDGIDVLKQSEKELSAFRNQHLGFVFQFHQLLPEFSAMENVMIPALIAHKSKQQAEQRAMELLKYLGIDHRADHRPNELSGGEKQRVAVARALVNNPGVILADEPSGSLDSRNKNELYDLLFQLREQMGQTIVIVTHDNHLAKISDRIIAMEDGRLA